MAQKTKSWKFYYTKEPRLKSNKASWSYDSANLHRLTTLSFANIIIQSQCDYHVGALASNRVRLVNELRSTNGRLGSGFVAINNAEW